MLVRVWRADKEVDSLTLGVEGGLGLRILLPRDRRSLGGGLIWGASVSPVAAGGSFGSAALLLVETRLLWTDVVIEFTATYVRLR